MAIEYQGKKVTPKTFAKHKISDHLMKVFDDPEKYMGPEFDTFTMKQQEDITNQVSLFEDRIHKLLGVKFIEIHSRSNFKKAI
tara:strand:+ start:3445 stop:3693 length:249 start_codon:yes stop_codon:yes gene_type:complete